MNSSVRQPLQALNSSERLSEKGLRPTAVSEVETFLKEIDKLQGENQKLKDRLKLQPSLTNQIEASKTQSENRELKNQLELLQHKLELQEKAHGDQARQLEINWKQDVAQLKFQLEQAEINHRQQFRQEQYNSKQEINKLQQSLSKFTNNENTNHNLVESLESELIEAKQTKNILEDRLEQVIKEFDHQSKDQEFTLMKQQAIITSQEQYLNDVKGKLSILKDQNSDLLNQNKQLKEIADSKSLAEVNLTNKLIVIEQEFKHVSETYNDHKSQLKSRNEELIQQYAKQTEMISLLQTQQSRDQDIINKLQTSLQNEEINHNNDINAITESKAKLISFLQSELLNQKERNHELTSQNQILDQQVKELKGYYQKCFRDLECKTNMLEGECNRLNGIIRQKDDSIFTLQALQSNVSNLDQTLDLSQNLEVKEQEIVILKQQNESLINDLSRQADNYRNLTAQHKQYQKYAEDVKSNNITITELQSKCEIQDKEIERLRMKVLEKSQLLEKVQKDNLEYQAKLKTRLR